MKFKVWNNKKTETCIDYSLVRKKVESSDEEDEEQTQNFSVTDSYESKVHLQIIQIPDFKHIPGCNREKYYVAKREPKEIRSDNNRTYSISPVKNIRGPYNKKEAISEVIMLYNNASIPIHENIRILRPNDFDEYYYWISCPNCEGKTEIDTELHIKSEREKSTLKIECTECQESVANEAKSRGEFEEWADCPICGSSDINYKCSIPYGFINFSCDSCNYNTKPSKVDDGFSETEVDLREFSRN